MADAKVIQFIQRAEEDPELGAKVRAVKVEDKPQAMAALAKIAAEAGYDLTPDALEIGLRECAANELSDGDLDAVAGGVVPCVGDTPFKKQSSVFGSFYDLGFNR